MPIFRDDIKSITYNEQEMEAILQIQEEAITDFSNIAKIYDIESLVANPFKFRRILELLLREFEHIDIFDRVSSLYACCEKCDGTFLNLVINFRVDLMDLKIEYDRYGYLKETSNMTPALKRLMTIESLKFRKITNGVERVIIAVCRQYISMLNRSYKRTTALLKEYDISDILDNEKYNEQIPVYGEMVDALFRDITPMELLELEEKLKVMWDRYCPQDVYALTKAGLEELYNRELLPNDDL